MMLRRAKAVLSPSPVVFFWDLDKTYLKSEFETLRELVRIPFEKPEEKVAVPGVVPLIRGLRNVASQAGRDVRIYFVSASPPQIAKAIKDKLALDGIEYDGIVFKDQLHHLVRGKFRNLREQVGYKLTELLKDRPARADAREVLFGDDWESDPLIYSLYADIVAGRVAPGDLDGILQTIGVDAALIAEATRLAAAITPAEAVSRIFINLERRTPPSAFQRFGPRLVPTFNYLQTAACLFQDGHLSLPAVATVAEALTAQSGYTPERLANSLADIERRGHLQPLNAIAVREYLGALGALPRRIRRWQSPWQRVRRWFAAQGTHPPADDVVINYHTLAADWRASR